MKNNLLWFLISFLVSLAMLYLIVAFITFDSLWFIHGWLGRLGGIILLIISFKAGIISAEDY